MRPSLASAAYAVLFSTCVSVVPARAQDFSITNKLEPAATGRADLIRQLQAWWAIHATYPADASASDQGGIVRVRVTVHPDGNIGVVSVLQGSGACALDTAGVVAFRGGHVRPFAASQPAADADVEITLHYVLTHRHDEPLAAGYGPAASRANFTISNDPVKPTVVDAMRQRVCTGTVSWGGAQGHALYGWRSDVTAIFFRQSNGSPWVKLSEGGFDVYSPVTETGNAVQWMGHPEHDPHDIRGLAFNSLWSLWPDGENRLTGSTDYPGGVVELNCTAEAGPAMTPTVIGWSVMPRFQSGWQDVKAGVCRK